MSRRLHSDPVRHLIAMAVVIVLSIGAAELVDRGSGTQRGAMIRTAFSMASMGMYGPVYLLLTWLSLRGLRGADFRAVLRADAKPSKLRTWVLAGSGPRTWAITLSLMALVAVLVLTAVGPGRSTVWLSASGIVCVAGCWVLLLAVFAHEYARRWARAASFGFPGDDDARCFEDFVYLAAQVSTTFSTSDVQVLDTKARGTVTVHTLTAWAFSTVIIALVVALALPVG